MNFESNSFIFQIRNCGLKKIEKSLFDARPSLSRRIQRIG